MKLKDKLRLMEKIEKRNQARIKAFTSKLRKRPSSSLKENTEDNRVAPKKTQ